MKIDKLDELVKSNYHQIADAINYLENNNNGQFDFEEVTAKKHISPAHIQKLFMKWSGVDPKNFLQYTSVEYAKKLLKENQATLFEAIHNTGHSSNHRIHDSFVKIEKMTLAEFENDGKNLSIHYSFADSLFGDILLASTKKGICHIAFVEDENQALSVLQNKFPNGEFQQHLDLIQQNALCFFSQDWQNVKPIKLHVKGTDFQLKVWDTLLKIPVGALTNYGIIAKQIGKPNASRAVGTAIGDNPVAFLIPCHRVVQSTGKLGGYMWGTTRKKTMIAWEAARINIDKKKDSLK